MQQAGFDPYLHQTTLLDHGLIHHLGNVLSGWIDHLHDPVFRTIVTGTDLGLPSRSMHRILQESNKISLASKNDRDLHVIMTSRFKNIWQAKDVDEFKRIFLDCLECHYHAYHTSRVIYRDVSENNLMIYQSGVTDKDDNKDSDSSISDSKEFVKLEGSSSPALPLARGILDDFDLAAVLNTDRGIDPDSAPHHHLTGTLPFMARDILDPSYSKDTQLHTHHYRYDLESFYYLLIWAAVQFDLKAGRRVAPKSGQHSVMREWTGNGDGQYSAYHAKVALHSGAMLKPYSPDVRPEWADMWNKWVRPWSKMFRHGFIALDDARDENAEDFDYATCGGHLTFENFVSAIGETPRSSIRSHL